jgi:iron complex transport system ATP-binding protein
MSAAFEATAVDFRHPGALRPTLERVDLTAAGGAFCAIIGPNGSGKTTLLRLLLGALRPEAGRIRYLDRDVLDWPRAELARRIGVVTQREEQPFPITVRELVAMGRYPHLGALRRAGREDELAVEMAMERCAVGEVAGRPVDQLSGGERQRARIARALAQQPATLVLDEPTAALDLAHEMAIFELLAGLCRNDGVTVLIATHNLNLASRYAARLLLLDRGRVAATGAPAAVLTRTILEPTYHWPLVEYPYPGPGRDHAAPQVAPLGPADTAGGEGEGPGRVNAEMLSKP